MTDIVAQLVGALELCQRALQSQWSPYMRAGEKEAAAMKAAATALSAAKDGGWVAVPVEPTPEMVEAARDVKRQRLVRAAAELKKGKHPDTIGMALSVNEEWTAMLAARPLPNPPKEQNT